MKNNGYNEAPIKFLPNTPNHVKLKLNTEHIFKKNFAETKYNILQACYSSKFCNFNLNNNNKNLAVNQKEVKYSLK